MFRVLGSLRHFGRTDARAGRHLMDGSRVGGQVTNESGLLVDGGLGCGSWPKQECCLKTLEDFMPKASCDLQTRLLQIPRMTRAAGTGKKALLWLVNLPKLHQTI